MKGGGGRKEDADKGDGDVGQNVGGKEEQKRDSGKLREMPSPATKVDGTQNDA